MKKFISSIAALLLFTGAANSQDPETFLKEGAQVPPLTIEMLGGGKISSADFEGKVVWLNFWATWCPPCRRELVRVQADVVDRFAPYGEKFLFLPVSIGEEADVVRKFVERMGYTFPVGLDADESVFRTFADSAIPRSFIIAPDGRVAIATLGYDSTEFDALLREVEALLDKATVLK